MPTGKPRERFPELYGYEAAARRPTNGQVRSTKAKRARQRKRAAVHQEIRDRIQSGELIETNLSTLPGSGNEKLVDTPEPEDKFKTIAQRINGAVKELNSALVEAHRMPEMMVFFAWDKDDQPMQFEYEIFRMTHKNSVVDIEQTATPFKYRRNNSLPK